MLINDLSSIVQSQDQISCNLETESVILNSYNGVYYGLDQVGSAIWDLIKRPISVKDITTILLKEYDVSLEQCKNNLLSFLKELYENKLIEIKE